MKGGNNHKAEDQHKYPKMKSIERHAGFGVTNLVSGQRTTVNGVLDSPKPAARLVNVDEKDLYTNHPLPGKGLNDPNAKTVSSAAKCEASGIVRSSLLRRLWGCDGNDSEGILEMYEKHREIDRNI